MPDDSEDYLWPEPGLQVASPNTGMVYTLTHTLGEGAFGNSWACHDEFDEALVAKVLRPRDTPREWLMADWQKEVSLLSLLRHPNVIHIYDAFEFGGMFYLILERADGSLRQLIETHGPLEESDVLEFGRQLLSALHFIHAHRVIHRDLQIDNVLYVDHENEFVAKVADFGISKRLDEEEGRAYTQIGRQFDIAPELLEHGYTTQQSDIYQLGLVLYHLLTGQPALSEDDGEVRDAILSGVAQERAEALQSTVGDWIAVMLRRHDRYRFESAVDVWLALKQGWEE